MEDEALPSRNLEGPPPRSGRYRQSATERRLEDQLRYYSRASATAKTRSQTLRVVELGLSCAVPVVAGLQASPLLTATLASLVVFLVGLREIFQWNNSWISYRATLEELKREEALYKGQADEYGTDQASSVLAKRIELIVSTENKSWQDVARENTHDHAHSKPPDERPR